MLVAPGAGLAGARVVVDQVNLYDGKAEIRKHVGETVTDDQGIFPALPTGTINGLVLIDASGGSYTDPINGARIQLDPSVHLKALHWLGVFEDRGESMYVTPVHALVEARFRYKMTVLHDTTQAANDAYTHLNAHFGGLDWEKVIPADLGVAAPSPTDEVRAAFVLGGLSVLTEGIRTASNSTPQVVNLMTLLDAAERDLSDRWLDGNDTNASALGSGLQVGDCPPTDATCAAPSGGCQLGVCRPLCDIYANTYRSITGDSIARFIGPKTSPSTWNRTSLGSEDARAFTDGITRNADADLFNDACAETQHRVPPTIVWEMAPADGALQGGTIRLRVHALDNDSNKLPTIAFPDYADTDGDPTNDFATVTVDTRAATGGADGALTVTAIATDLAGNRTTSTRTFQVDNTPPVVTLDSSGLYVDSGNIWWTATPGPTLHGTVSDAHPGTVQVMIGGNVVATAEVNGTQWSAQLPENALSTSGGDVSIVATDQVGNTGTKVQTLRLDTTPPSVGVDPSLVHDEINSKFNWIDDATGSFAEHEPSRVIPAVDLATTGSCPTVHKYAQLLFAPNPDGSHAVPGSSGDLNPLRMNAVVTDDGVGVQPDSLQYRVLFRDGATLTELLPWTAMPPPNGSQHPILLVQNAIPQLGTTNGEYHVQLRATDQFGRITVQERCWNHVILAPPLRPTSTDPSGNVSPGGEKATGFQRALWSTSLDPGPNETGDFAAKFLNTSATGAAVWRARFKNYLGLDVYVKMQIPIPDPGISATVSREFRVMNSLTNFRSVTNPVPCGGNGAHCNVHTPQVAYDSGFNPVTQNGLRFRARLFLMNGNETDAEIGTCPGCTSDDVSQTYVFKIPARTVSQTPLEYAFLTYLVPTLPTGAGTNVVMAPSNANSPDGDPAPYTEFQFNDKTLTGKPGPPPPPSDSVCVGEDQTDTGQFVCSQVAGRQDYRALVKVQYTLNNDLDTTYSFAAMPSLLTSDPQVPPVPGRLKISVARLVTTETQLP